MNRKVDINEAAELTGMSVSWFRAQILRKCLPFYRIGRRILFDIDDLGEVFERNRVEPSKVNRLELPQRTRGMEVASETREK